VETGRLVRSRPHHLCVGLPAQSDVSRADPAYLIVDLMALWSTDDEDSRPLRVHLYQLAPDEFRVVGVERPTDLDPPSAQD